MVKTRGGMPASVRLVTQKLEEHRRAERDARLAALALRHRRPERPTESSHVGTHMMIFALILSLMIFALMVVVAIKLT